ncbi:MAG: hypothetical protein FJ138_11560, partial [Deltaproteobacteria bacterium]|nr:hypothetical protein [Deltaproteobacteria bacterium]
MHAPPSRAARRAEALARHTPALTLCAALLTALLSYPMLMWAPTELASTTPQTPLFEAAARARARLAGAAHVMSFVVEAPEGESLLSAPHVRRLHAALEAVRADPRLGPKLQRYRSDHLGLTLHGALSVGDLAAAALAARGLRLAEAPDALVEEAAQAAAARLAETPSQLLILSGRSARDAAGRWRAPAVVLSALGDGEALGGAGEITLSEARPARELFARELRDALRAHAAPLRVHGVALDVNLSKQEQGAASAPLLALALLLNLGLIAVSFRGYWAVTLIGLGVATMMIWLRGGSNLLGLKSDTILSLIVPIAMVSFGIDAGVHAVARYREERAGRAPAAAAVAGLAGVRGALRV